MKEHKTDYITKQIQIIQSKNSIYELNRYESALLSANINKRVKEKLLTQCDKRRSQLSRSPAMIEQGDISDMM